MQNVQARSIFAPRCFGRPKIVRLAVLLVVGTATASLVGNALASDSRPFAALVSQHRAAGREHVALALQDRAGIAERLAAVERRLGRTPVGDQVRGPSGAIRESLLTERLTRLGSLPLGATGLLAKRSQGYSDAIGDAQGGLAPDLSSLAAVNEADGTVGFGMSYANRVCAGSGDFIAIFLDVDLNPATGSSAIGAEYSLFLDGSTRTAGVARWNGSSFDITSVPAVGSCSSTTSPPFDVIAVNAASVGIASRFNFLVGALWSEGPGATSYSDFAGPFNYSLSGAQPPPPPAPTTPASPGNLDGSFTVTTVRPQVGRPVTFQASDPNGVSYEWDFGDGRAKTTRGPAASHVYTTTGNYTVTLSVNYADGSLASDSRNVQVTGGILDGAKLPTTAGPSASSRKDPAYSRAASTLARGARAVFCWNADDWSALTARDQANHPDSILLGFVDRSKPHQINLAPRVCAGLDAVHYAETRPQPTTSLAVAVHALTHETIHTINTRLTEAVTECFAVQLSGRTSVALGTSEAYGRRLTQLFWRNFYLAGREPPSYRHSECHNGGKLDLFPEDDVWP